MAVVTGGAGDPLISRRAAADVEVTADPATPFWQEAPLAIMENDRWERPIPSHRTEIRSRWTDQNLYLLFVCPYEELYLRPNPSTTTETNELWEWDVAEVFIGADFENIRRYREFQVSPQGEWVDLDIDRDEPKPEGGWRWNSEFEVKARLDRDKKTWYGEMRIPIKSIDSRPPVPGNEMRINLYRIQGPPKGEGSNGRLVLSWRPTFNRSNHVPESFGTIRLEP
ncbi:MAG: hypothetical protein GEV06_13185 [Luteitalea sp.]|nr:hypothetical protein [Luteitalea sp.]